jgi:hypothetical protein
VIIIADGHELPICAGHRREQTYGTPQALLWSYGAEAQAIGVGSTGGGPDIPGHPQVSALDWEELAEDLRLARRSCDDLLIHSLEGCVQQGFLPRLRTFDWDQEPARPANAWLAASLRRTLLLVLWASAHPWQTLGLASASIWILARRGCSRRLPA